MCGRHNVFRLARKRSNEFLFQVRFGNDIQKKDRQYARGEFAAADCGDRCRLDGRGVRESDLVETLAVFDEQVREILSR